MGSNEQKESQCQCQCGCREAAKKYAGGVLSCDACYQAVYRKDGTFLSCGRIGLGVSCPICHADIVWQTERRGEIINGEMVVAPAHHSAALLFSEGTCQCDGLVWRREMRGDKWQCVAVDKSPLHPNAEMVDDTDDEEMEQCRCQCGCDDDATTHDVSGTPLCSACSQVLFSDTGDFIACGNTKLGEECPQCKEVIEWSSIQTGERSRGEPNFRTGHCRCREWREEDRGGWVVVSVTEGVTLSDFNPDRVAISFENAPPLLWERGHQFDPHNGYSFDVMLRERAPLSRMMSVRGRIHDVEESWDWDGEGSLWCGDARIASITATHMDDEDVMVAFCEDLGSRDFSEFASRVQREFGPVIGRVVQLHAEVAEGGDGDSPDLLEKNAHGEPTWPSSTYREMGALESAGIRNADDAEAWWYQTYLPDTHAAASHYHVKDGRPHLHRVQSRETRGFSHCVAIYPHTHCNPASHGGVTFHETCECGAQRKVNATGDEDHTEESPWLKA